MADNFIPVGRTSMAKQGDKNLQVQTEYAPRPAPRITTTISHQGQVIHKIERNLDHAVESPEEQDRVERTLRNQHSEVIGIIKNGATRSQTLTNGNKPAENTEPTVMQRSSAVVEDTVRPQSTTAAVATEEPQSIPAYERIQGLPGVTRVYRIDNEGNFIGGLESEFKKTFNAIFKNLQELIALYDRLPGVGITRQKGVYEIKQGGLYFVSVGLECYIVVVGHPSKGYDYESAIKDFLD